VEQGETYRCDGKDLTKPTPDQYERYSDGSHRGKKKVDEKTEAERKRLEVRTKAGELSKKDDGSKSSKETEIVELMKRREEQVTVQNAGKVEARKRGDVLEQERAAAEKKMWAEQQKKDSDEKKKRAKEEWQRKQEDRIQLEKSLAKALEIEGGKVGSRRDMTSAEMDQEFRDLNAAQMRINTRAAVDQVVRSEASVRKGFDKGVIAGKRMMRAEGTTEECSRLSPIVSALSAESEEQVDEIKTLGVENTKIVKEKKVRKVLGIHEKMVEEMDVEGGEEDFSVNRRMEVILEMPLELPGDEVIEIEETVEVLTTDFLQEILSDRMEMGNEYDLRVQEIVEELEESGGEGGACGSPSRSVKEELIEREGILRENRKAGDGKMSSGSVEEIDKIIIEDSVGEDSFMVRTVGLEGCCEEIDQTEHMREVSTPPVSESTPNDERIMRRGAGNSKPQYVAKKKLWVEPDRTIEEEKENSSDGESITSRHSTVSRRYVERRASGEGIRGGAQECCLHGRPRGFGSREAMVRVKQDPDTGLHVVGIAGEDDQRLVTGDRVRVVSARSWLGGGELVQGGDIAVGGELDDVDEHLLEIILSTPPPWTVPRILQQAVIAYPDRAPWHLRSIISTMLLTMRKTTQHILMQSIRNAPAVNPLTAMTVPLDMDTVAKYLSASN